MTLQQLADKYIPAPENKTVLTKAQGITRDIMTEVLNCYKESKGQLKLFAPFLKGSTVLETCRNIWNFWKSNITYQVDDEGVQLIKTPASVWASKYCDCKSFSVAVAACLYCLGIKGKIRFTSYGSNTEMPTHVYVVALDGSKEIIIDCVWTGFNSEKPYTKKWEYNMTNIYRVSGTNDTAVTRRRHVIGALNVDLNEPGLTEGELDLGLTIQGLELEQKIMRRTGVFGIGSTHDDRYQVLIEGHRVVLNELWKERNGIVTTPEQQAQKYMAWKRKNPSVGDIGFLKKLGKAIKKVAKKVGKGLKNAVKAVKKVVSTPARLAAQGSLQEAGGFFLYMFIDPKKIPIEKLPQIVQVKRAKALEYKSRIEKKLQMPWKNFDKIARNGVMQAFGNTPENVLAQWMQQANFKIGFLPLATAATGLLSKAGGALKSLFGKFDEDLGNDLEQFTPSPEDWGTMSADAAQSATSAWNSNSAGGGGYYGSPGGNYASEADPNYSYADRTSTGNNSNAGKEGYDANGAEIWDEYLDEETDRVTYTSRATGRVQTNAPFTGNGENVINNYDPVIRSNMKAKESGNSTGLLLAGLAAVVLLSKK